MKNKAEKLLKWFLIRTIIFAVLFAFIAMRLMTECNTFICGACTMGTFAIIEMMGLFIYLIRLSKLS